MTVQTDIDIDPFTHSQALLQAYHNSAALFIYFYKFIYFTFGCVLGLRCCARAFSSCGKRGLLFVAVRRLLIAVASLVGEHRL